MKNSTCKWEIFFLIILLLVLALAMGVVLERKLTAQTVPTCSYIKIEEDGDYELYTVNEEGLWTYTQVLGGNLVEYIIFVEGCTEEDIINFIGSRIEDFRRSSKC